MLREFRTLEQRTLTARDLIARELRHNAAVVADAERIHDSVFGVLEPQYSWPFDSSAGWKAVRDRIDLTRWRQHGLDLAMLRRRNPDLWTAVGDAYDALALGVSADEAGITSDALSALSERLFQASL
jgi:hypothetical protein